MTHKKIAMEHDKKIAITKLQSGPLGGNQQIGAKMQRILVKK